jgi:hypothetical protein
VIIAINITLDIGLLIDEFGKFASKTTLNNIRNSQWTWPTLLGGGRGTGGPPRPTQQDHLRGRDWAG